MNWRTHLFPLRGLILHPRDVEIVHRSLHRVKFAVSEQTLPHWPCWAHSSTGFWISILAASERSVTLLCTPTFLSPLSRFIVSTPSLLHCEWEERKVQNNWLLLQMISSFSSLNWESQMVMHLQNFVKLLCSLREPKQQDQAFNYQLNNMRYDIVPVQHIENTALDRCRPRVKCEWWILAACKENEGYYGSQQDLHLINKILTLTAAGGNAIPLKWC